MTIERTYKLTAILSSRMFELRVPYLSPWGHSSDVRKLNRALSTLPDQWPRMRARYGSVQTRRFFLEVHLPAEVKYYDLSFLFGGKANSPRLPSVDVYMDKSYHITNLTPLGVAVTQHKYAPMYTDLGRRVRLWLRQHKLLTWMMNPKDAPILPDWRHALESVKLEDGWLPVELAMCRPPNAMQTRAYRCRHVQQLPAHTPSRRVYVATTRIMDCLLHTGAVSRE